MIVVVMVVIKKYHFNEFQLKWIIIIKLILIKCYGDNWYIDNVDISVMPSSHRNLRFRGANYYIIIYKNNK